MYKAIFHWRCIMIKKFILTVLFTGSCFAVTAPATQMAMQPGQPMPQQNQLIPQQNQLIPQQQMQLPQGQQQMQGNQQQIPGSQAY